MWCQERERRWGHRQHYLLEMRKRRPKIGQQERRVRVKPEEEYKLRVQKIAREIFLKQREIVRDVKDANIREEEKAEITLQLIKMLTDSHLI